jgi:hypothetical protein
MSSSWEYVYLNDFGDYDFERLTLKDVINLTRYYLSIRKKFLSEYVVQECNTFNSYISNPRDWKEQSTHIK